LNGKLIALGCAPQKVNPASRCNFFEPVFMVQPTENIVRSYPAVAWQLMPMVTPSRSYEDVSRLSTSGEKIQSRS
jgi:hypothetical protein